MYYVHLPVLLTQVLHGLVGETDQMFLDCTIGEGGHTEAILNAYPLIKALGIDRDAAILEVAKRRLRAFGDRFSCRNMNFIEAKKLAGEGFLFDVALIDLGISVFHYKNSGRGFSFLKEEPLDMRLDDSGVSVEKIVNTWSKEEITKLLYNYAEERFAPRIAERIIQARDKQRIMSSMQLATLISNAIPAKFQSRKTHPATKSFQAFRIAANNELANIQPGIDAVLATLKPGGKLGVISFHSLEDRIVKKYFSSLAIDCVCPPRMPICVCGHKAQVKIVGKSMVADKEECEKNPPSRSARLRIVEKL